MSQTDPPAPPQDRLQGVVPPGQPGAAGAWSRRPAGWPSRDGRPEVGHEAGRGGGRGDAGGLGVVPPGQHSVTLYDVARVADVSTATVSRVVHGQDKVRDSTRQRVLRVIEQLGYVPDGAAQSLSRRHKNVIGLVCVEHVGLAPQQYDIESMSLLFYDEVLRGVEARIRDRNWSLLITYLREANDLDIPRLLSLSGKVDGLLIGEGIVPSAFVARLANRMPVVVVAGDPEERAADVVDRRQPAGAAALVTPPHRRPRQAAAVPRGRAAHRSGREGAAARAAGRAAGSSGHASSSGSFHGLFSVQQRRGGRREAARQRTATRCPTRSSARTTRWRSACCRRSAGPACGCPRTVAVVGFDDIFPGSLCDPPLTTVHQPMRLLGERACTRLLDRIARPACAPGGTAADRARAALQLRLPARHA